MLAKKMRITAGATIVALHAPDNYAAALGPLPEGVTIKHKAAKQNAFIQLFVHNKAELEREIFKACAALEPGGLIWICYPKGSSGMQTDLTRDKGWECLEQIDMNWLSLISFDDKWSAFLMQNVPRQKTPPGKTSTEYHDNVAAYTDPKTKTVIVPEDLEQAFRANKAAAANFHALAYSHRKEYVLWIVSAKRAETRERRVQQTIEMLLQNRKNPADKG